MAKEQAGATDEPALMKSLVAMCQRRGYVFQSSEIYGGLKSCYDYGPLGAELKRNIRNEWWRAMVHERDDVVGLDASIIMHPDVWKASGHLAGFTDPLVDCHSCQARFRADKAPTVAAGSPVTYTVVDPATKKKSQETSEVGKLGIVCPVCGSPKLSDIRQFNTMFQTSLGPVSPVANIVAAVQKLGDKAGDPVAMSQAIDEAMRKTAVYLRPETAQAMFVNFLNVQASQRLKPPFGIAQVGKSFRNEITVEHFIFRSCEFEQMEMEFFVPPPELSAEGKTPTWWHEHWCQARMEWYRSLGLDMSKLRLRQHAKDELAHYAREKGACFDVEYNYPWGWGELEGIASRTDYDLKAHSTASGKKLTYFDPNLKQHYTPWVIEPASGADRIALVALIDAFEEIPADEKEGEAGKAAPAEGQAGGQPGAKPGEPKLETVLRLHPRLAPIKAAVLPLVKKDGLPEISREIIQELRGHGINAFYDEKDAIGRRYRRQDEVGTPYCIAVDYESTQDRSVTVRFRDDRKQIRVKIEEVITYIEKQLRTKTTTVAPGAKSVGWVMSPG
ncbi:MAG TPA: glycine--tRNA ligase [Planctomycetota bacterium]|nr:glycine--tRNA ligase [Planctomycetota bacterium]